MHLSAAATLVPALADVQMASITPGLTISGNKTRREDERILYSENASAIGFLLGSFLFLDIISCASTRSDHLLQLDHKLLLEHAEINLESITRCRNWAIIVIFEISLLDRWKREAEKAQKLSIVELAKCGGQIEERLRERLADIENKPSIGFSSENNSRTSLAFTYTEVTKIFAFAAMTYLHVVMSGAYPELPEIIESVSKTIDPFQRLSDKRLLRNLVWPFCISGCLALDGQHDIFRDLVSAAEITQSTTGTCFEALKIVEECWDTRKTHLCNCDWYSVMKKWGYYVLLY